MVLIVIVVNMVGKGSMIMLLSMHVEMRLMVVLKGYEGVVPLVHVATLGLRKQDSRKENKQTQDDLA